MTKSIHNVRIHVAFLVFVRVCFYIFLLGLSLYVASSHLNIKGRERGR